MTAKSTNSSAAKRQATSNKTPTTSTSLSNAINNFRPLPASQSPFNFSSKKTFSPPPVIPKTLPKQKTLQELIDGYNASKNKKKIVPVAPKPKPPIVPVIEPPPLNPGPDYRFNLPPHKWSLPLEPDAVSPDTVVHRDDSHHATRRGRIWYYNGYVGPTSAPDYQSTGIYTPPAGAKGSSNKYGFQFMWNPETFSQNTAVNMSITPSAADPTIALTGFAAANSTMSFTLRLDRTNDFACAKNLVSGPQNAPLTDVIMEKYQRYLASLSDIVPFYSVGNLTTNTVDIIEENISNLLSYGTEADLEFLYKTINGSGWTGIGGRQTSNIGYLMPSLIRLDLGNQKFVGVVSDIEVNHLAFTRDLVPIRTDVNITVDLRANIQPTTNNGAVGR
jgi:hypothetical protein